MSFKFTIEKELKTKGGEKNSRGRAGIIETARGAIQTPAFVVVGTKATVKALTPEQVNSLGAQAVLANTYHLYLEPGEKIVKEGGGLRKFMNWSGPTFTDSGGFQAFSLGVAYGKKVSKVGEGTASEENRESIRSGSLFQERRRGEKGLQEARMRTDFLEEVAFPHTSLAKVSEDGVTFKSIIDGSTHYFTPEKSMEIQHDIGADIIFAFDECTSPTASYEYQREAMDRTHRWAKRSLDHHQKIGKGNSLAPEALFGIVQGGRHEDLRKESAKTIGEMDFDGFGIGGSFDKEDIDTAVGWVNDILPKGKPRHLLGIGEPTDLIMGIENGIDTFDCVAPTRMARNGNLYTTNGRINILNAKFKTDFTKVDAECGCYTCNHYTRAYLSHLFRSEEMLGATLASIHNLYFIVHFVDRIREKIVEGSFEKYRDEFLEKYKK